MEWMPNLIGYKYKNESSSSLSFYFRNYKAAANALD